MLIISCTKERNEEVPFSMAIGNWELCTSGFPNTHAWEQQEWNKTIRQTKTLRRDARVWKKCTAGTNKRNPDGLSHLNRNTIINNLVKLYKKWKKNNEIQLTKNKMDLNNRKMTNHPPSPEWKKTWDTRRLRRGMSMEKVKRARKNEVPTAYHYLKKYSIYKH